MARLGWFLALLLLTGPGCGGDEIVGPPQGAAIDIPEGCNPLASEHHCLLPYPSDVFLVGGRVAIAEPALPHNEDGEAVDTATLHPADGFSPGNQILALFPQGFDDAPLVGATDDLLDSLGDASPTVLLDAETGERVLHLAEIDPRAETDDRRALLIRPLVRLRDGARYLVAIRRLADAQGSALPAPAGFARLRDGGDTSHPALAPLAARYDAEVFAPLEEAGVARDELQLAWDFTVRSRESAAADMLAVRQMTMDALAASPPQVTVVSVEDQPEEFQHRRIEATIEVPLFLDDVEPNAALYRDGDGRVAQNGTAVVPFTVIVPESVAAAPAGSPPARLLQFGHGFFGGRAEIHGFIDQLSDERGFVVVAADWWGMSAPDRDALIGALLDDTRETMRFTDRVHQAMANFIALAHAAQGGLVDLPELAIGEPPLFDDAALYFYGISQGHILGGSYLALSPSIERGVLSVGGADLTLMLYRARPFLPFLALIMAKFPDPLDHQILTAMMQLSFDRVDPLTYAPMVFEEPLDGAPDKQLLMQIGIGDAAVPNIGAHLHARALGLTLLEPAPRPLAGIEAAPAPLDSAIVEFDFGIDPLPGAVALPADDDNEVHEGVRRLEAAKEQLDRFFSPGGLVEATCDGPCDPE
jgi:hypothetical protein